MILTTDDYKKSKQPRSFSYSLPCGCIFTLSFGEVDPLGRASVVNDDDWKAEMKRCAVCAAAYADAVDAVRVASQETRV